MNKPLRKALIGSRKLSDGNKKELEKKYYEKCFLFACNGDIMTSGLCPTGPDAIAQRAYSEAIQGGFATASQLEVYVSEQRFIKESVLPNKEYSIVMPSHLEKERMDILRQVMNKSHIEACSPYALGMHQRNVHQVLGIDLKSPVDEVHTWCIIDKHGEPLGGTRTAIKIAQLYGIPVYNDYDPNYAQSVLSSFTF